MKKMGFKTSTQVKTAYMNALIAVGNHSYQRWSWWR